MRTQLLLTFVCLFVIQFVNSFPVETVTGSSDSPQTASRGDTLHEQFAKEERERVQKQKDEEFNQQLRRERERLRQESRRDLTNHAPVINQPSIQQRSDDTEAILKSFSALLQPKIMGSGADGKLMPIAQTQTVGNSQMVSLQSQSIPNQQPGMMPQSQTTQPATSGQAPALNDAAGMDARMMAFPAGYGNDAALMQQGAALYPYQQGMLPMGRTLAEQQQLQQMQNAQLLGRDVNGNLAYGYEAAPMYYGNQVAGNY